MKTILFLLIILILGSAAFAARSNWWIVPDINQWQGKMMGDNSYFPALTVIILALPPLLLVAGFKWWWQKRTGTK